MMNTMNNTGWGFGLNALWALHILSVIAFFVGVSLLLFWAFKYLSAKQLTQWGWALIVGGAIVCLFTIGVMGHPWTGNGMNGGHRMMQYDNKDVGSQSGMMGNGMGMSMMLRGKSGDSFDRAFIQMMIPHHQDAINMANMALENAKHDEMKNLARDIISAQQREIDMMKQWEKDWGYTQ